MTSAFSSSLAFDEGSDEFIVLGHKIFTVSDDGHFRMAKAGDVPVYVMPYGEDSVSLPFAGLIQEFGIAPESEDFRNLGLVEESLRYVSVIRPGDPIPREVMTGEASWQFTATHRKIAYGRLALQLVAWLTKAGEVPADGRDLLAAMRDPDISVHITAAIDEAAVALGYGPGGSERVVSEIEKMAGELAYIELLRETFASIIDVNERVAVLRDKYIHEQSVMDSIVPVLEFLGTAIKQYSGKFGEIDEIARDVIESLKSIVTKIRIVQEVRNDLYCRLRAWDEILPQWSQIQPRRSAAAEQLLRRTYRFLAPRYLQADEWVLAGALQPDDADAEKIVWALGD